LIQIFTFVVLVGVPTRALPAPKPFIEVSPQGTIKGARQVTARFALPMVTFGDPRASRPPFDVECSEKGNARWVDDRTWVYDFERDLPPGVRCTFTVRGDLTTLANKPVAGATYKLSSGGPSVEHTSPAQGDDTIEEEQAFILMLDAEPDPATVTANVYFEVQGLPQPIGVRRIEGADRDMILSTLWESQRARPAIVVQPKQRFPNDTKVTLVWGKGVTTTNGVANDLDQRFELKTRKVFTANVRCERQNARSGCIPLTPIRLSFSAPVAWSAARQIVLTQADGRRLSPQAPEGSQTYVESVEFKPPFAESVRLRLELPPDLRDDAGRTLTNADKFPQIVTTGPYPPLAKFSSRFGIIEAAEPVLPVTVRSLEASLSGTVLKVPDARPPAPKTQDAATVDPHSPNPALAGNVMQIAPTEVDQIWSWLRRVARARRDRSLFAGTAPTTGRRPLKLPKPNGAKAFEVVGIPLGQPGLYVVELASPVLGAALLDKKRSLYVPTAALVTNLAVHFKWGAESALAWVTTLDAGTPVNGAQVRVQDCKGKVLWQGPSGADGIAKIGQLPAREALANCFDDRDNSNDNGIDMAEYYATPALTNLDSGLFVTASTSSDLTFLHSSWNEGIQPWRFNLPSTQQGGPLVAHTVLDRSLLRAGETLHMKHVLRKQGLAGLLIVPEAERPDRVTIRHLGSDQHYDLPVQWDSRGHAEMEWPIPKEVKLGRYEITLSHGGEDAWWNRLTAAEFRVQELRVPLMRATVQLPTQPQVAAPEVPVDVNAVYLSGGAASKLPVVVRAQVRERDLVVPDDYDAYTFANGRVSAGLQAASDDESSPSPAVHQREELSLDDGGGVHTLIRGLPPADTIRSLLVEAEYRDPNGEVQTVSSSVPLWPAAWVAGIKADYWASTDSIAAKVAVLDATQRPVVGAPVVVQALERKLYSHRKRLVGGFYGYDHTEEIVDLGEICRGVTAADGTFECLKPPPGSGQLIVQATVSDAAGRSSTANTDLLIRGSEDHWFEVEDSDRIDVIPERRTYEPGETARFQVRMPFRAATALVSVEREGIAEAFVTEVSAADPVVEVPILASYAPNVFVSVLAVRGRSAEFQPTAMVDLGRPAFKLGLAEIRVGWRAHALSVAVKPEREVYKVRETARVSVQVAGLDGVVPTDAEVAIAAVDEGLLELAPNKSWSLLEAMMGRRGYGVTTATAQMQVVGKRHYGLKALPHGGGGGRQGTRELFDTLLLWRGRVPLDAKGTAMIDVPLNDSLTAFRIVAVASAGADRFGTGAATIRSTQDLSLSSGVPPFVRDGDHLRAESTVRNSTQRAMAVQVRARAEGLGRDLPEQIVHLQAGEAKTIAWDLTIPSAVDTLIYEIEASEAGGARDQVRLRQHVLPAVPVRILQASIYRWEDAAAAPITVARPPDAIAGRGGIRVDAAASIAKGLGAAGEWMRAYPYTCLEQRLSRAVALVDEGLWRELTAALPSFVDDDGLLKYFPRQAEGSDVLTAYVLSLSLAAGLPLPADVQSRMERGLRSFIDGSIRRTGALAAPDLVMRKLAALVALARAGKAEASLLGSLSPAPNLWPTSALLDWWELLQRLPTAPQRRERIREAEQIVRSRLTVHGTTLGLSTEHDDDLPWLMVDGDSNAARLLLFVERFGLWREDTVRLLRGLLGRQRNGRWQSTVANAWARLAVDEFARAFESVKVEGSVRVELAGLSESQTWTDPPQVLSFHLPWQPSPQPLAIRQQGAGQPWITVQSSAALPLSSPMWSGYQITKTMVPIEQRLAGKLSRGDLMRVRVEIEAQSDMAWVVVNDPIAAGAAHVGTGSARDSTIAQQGETQEGAALPVFEERPRDAYRAYYELLPKGRTITEYTLRFNHGGRFHLPPTRVEAMYAAEVFGDLPNATLEVEP